MLLTLILPAVLLVALIATLPIWPHSKKWGFYPLGGISFLILLLLFLIWTHRL